MNELFKSRGRVLYVFTDTCTYWKLKNNLLAFLLVRFFSPKSVFSELLLKFSIMQTVNSSCLFVFLREKQTNLCSVKHSTYKVRH